MSQGPRPDSSLDDAEELRERRIRDSLKATGDYIERARQYHAEHGEWPPDPLLDEVREMRSASWRSTETTGGRCWTTTWKLGSSIGSAPAVRLRRTQMTSPPPETPRASCYRTTHGRPEA